MAAPANFRRWVCLPAALQGIDIDGSDRRWPTGGCGYAQHKTLKIIQQPCLALAWYASGNGKGTKNMVVLAIQRPVGAVLQVPSTVGHGILRQRAGSGWQLVNQGICVLGNKGSTDQHSYIQQLRDGLNDFFVTFIEVQKDQVGEPLYTEPDATSGDFLEGFFLGTRAALAENDRESVTITVTEVDAATIGLLIGLFERAVGFYASLVNVNAYHQPGVEAGKKAAGNVLNIQREILAFLKSDLNQPFTVQEVAESIQKPDQVETVFKVLEHLSANPSRKIKKKAAQEPFEARYRMV